MATVLSRTSVQHITKEEFETPEMRECVTAYHDTLNKHIDTTSEFGNEDNGDDLVRDDETVPARYEAEGEYFGL